MVSFCKLLEAMEKNKQSPLMDSGEEGEILSVIRAGKDLRQEGDTPFWDDFIMVCNNTRGLADLLDVSPEKIRSWPSKIQEALTKLQTHDVQSPNTETDTEVIPTGQNGAVTTNQDPYLGEM